MQKANSVCSYILEAYVKADEIHLSEEEMTLIAKIKEARMNELRDYEERPRVPSSNLNSHKAKTRIGSVKRSHTREHPTLPSWNCKIFFDASNPESVVLKPYGPTPAELKAVQRSWLGEDPTLRLEEARKVRQAYILTKSLEEPTKTADFVEGETDTSGNTSFGIPVVDEEEYAELASLLSCTYSEERKSELKVTPETNGTDLKHYSEKNIHREICELVHLAEENQVKSINN
ncbi:unnamed protein product [Taenia asiatica]|uniref:HMG box domain-containing protein n=1 Tax=Taenia asiatica TaxID=60517 RepID=A0A0R3W333_TAEAS|nr:unnamed protein product [Taenia asiatica]